MSSQVTEDQEASLKQQYMHMSDDGRGSTEITLPEGDYPPIKLVALDLDGTTLHEDKSFSPRLIEVVHKLQDQGVIFAICSGRAPESIKPFADQLKLSKGAGYCICFNGGALINLSDIKEDLFISTLTAQDMIEIEAVARKFGCVIHAYSTRRVLLTESDITFTQMEIASSMQDFEHIKFPEEVDPKEEAYKLIAVGDSLKLDDIRHKAPAEFLDRYNVARTHPNFLEFMHKNCSKGTTLRRLCKLLGIKMENVAAFGDAENDIAMVRDSGVGVAVANAMPALKAVAKYKTLHYMDDGVAVYLEKLFGLK